MVLLPKLLYLGDVPVEAPYHGSAVRPYRLAKVRVAETELFNSEPERGLPGVT